MKKILFDENAVYHTLTHFEALDDKVRAQLHSAGFDDESIDAQLRAAGSKFFVSFARSPQMVVEKLIGMFPRRFEHASVDVDGRVRLSFDCKENIGTQKIIDETELMVEERLTIREEKRGGYCVRTVQTDRMIPTRICQLILTINDGDVETGYLCSLFPGELAPPLFSPEGGLDPYWKTHLFIR
ncbi:hypothetical protein B5G09_07945 [Alistipes sp. An54]|uniref:hypothetical protein n=1 Tax=Alistipes sp. An54 TaxID=1965645 RepID=UPI000B39A3AA|nr:hypothetical protein [Alistipes sp. An54]OUN76893.1 hypothetical protein B5G09_07945 [Alistipes sp. An54]